MSNGTQGGRWKKRDVPVILKKERFKKGKSAVPVILDRHLREQIARESNDFPISFFENELSELPNREGPLHWHPDFEIARAERETLEYQVGQERILLQPGDSLFVNGNLLHGVKQVGGDAPDPMPIAVFSGSLIGPESGVLHQKYIAPVAKCASLPFVRFRRQDERCGEVHSLLDELFSCLRLRPVCWEMRVQRLLCSLFEYLFRNLDSLPRCPATRVQLRSQVRVQQMLAYIYEHYEEQVTVDDIARAASVCRSEATRCFQEYMGCSPVSALIRHRLQTAHRLLHDRSVTVQEVCCACGFRSPNYFARQFRKLYGYTPGHVRGLGE